jgi:hypothetical protein
VDREFQAVPGQGAGTNLQVTPSHLQHGLIKHVDSILMLTPCLFKSESSALHIRRDATSRTSFSGNRSNPRPLGKPVTHVHLSLRRLCQEAQKIRPVQFCPRRAMSSQARMGNDRNGAQRSADYNRRVKEPSGRKGRERCELCAVALSAAESVKVERPPTISAATVHRLAARASVPPSERKEVNLAALRSTSAT